MYWLLLEILFEIGKKRETICYGNLVDEINRRIGKKLLGKSRGDFVKLGRMLHVVCLYCYRNWKILPASTVVLKSKKVPSKGYFSFLTSLGVSKGIDYSVWKKEKRRFYEFCNNFLRRGASRFIQG